MATKALTQFTLVEAAKQTDPDGSAATIAEILDKKNELWGVIPLMQSNDVSSHVFTVRDKLPTISTRQVNRGSTLSVSSRKQTRVEMVHLEDWIRADELVIDRQADPKMHLMNEVVAHVEAMDQEIWERFFYDTPGDAADGILGLSNRYNLSSMANVDKTNAGSGSDTTSVWMLEPGFNTIYIVYPKGSTAGVSKEDKGKRTVYDSVGPYDAYEVKLAAEFGLVPVDPRGIQRFANIESSGVDDTLFDVSSFEYRNLVNMRNRLPNGGRGGVLLMNRTTKAQADILAWDKSTNAFSRETWDGQPVTTFQGMRVIMVEALVDTETALT
jgi:hypothetical protein